MVVKYWNKQLKNMESPSLKLCRQNLDKYHFTGNPEMWNFLCWSFKENVKTNVW